MCLVHKDCPLTMDYHTAALIGILVYMYVTRLPTVASTASPFRKPVLSSYPSRPTNGGLFTLTCNYNGNTADGDFFVMRVFWYRDNSLVVISPSGTVKQPDLEGRVSVEHNAYQHNISISINASTDNGSVWWCSDDFTRQNSNNMTISFSDEDDTQTTPPSSSSTVASSTASSTAAIVSSATTSASTTPNDVSKAAITKDDDNTSFISVIAGVVVAAIVIIILIMIVMGTTSRRREVLREGDGILSESFHHHAVDSTRSKYKGTDVNTVLEYVHTPWDNSSVTHGNVLYFRSSDVLSLRPSQRVSPTNTGLYAQIYKPMSASEQRVSASDVFVEDVHTRPCKIPRVEHVFSV